MNQYFRYSQKVLVEQSSFKSMGVFLLTMPSSSVMGGLCLFMFFKCFARLRFRQSKKHTKGKTLCHVKPSVASLVTSVSSCSSQNDHAISHRLCWHQKILSDLGLGFLCLKLSSIYSVIAFLRTLTRHLGLWCDVRLVKTSYCEALFKDEAGFKWSLRCLTQLGKAVMFFRF